MKTSTAFLSLLLGLLLTTQVRAQFSLSGRIRDADEAALLPGATVQVTGTPRGTTSRPDGTYRLDNLPAGTYTLRVSYIGFETLTRTLTLRQNETADFSLRRSTFTADEVIVSATRVNERSAMAYTNVTAEEIRRQNLGQDLPVLLNFQPSLVSTSDAGAGVGYTGFRIRGSDATRINVTLNGIPYNDAESQGTFWVNMPDFASSVSSIQIQRGVGTSTNGAGAFGATVNIQTNELRKEAYAETNHGVGSFNTWRNNVLVGTGLLNGKFTIDARLSRLKSDGYIDRASSDLKSFYLSGGYFGKKSFVRLNVFSGLQETYQAWEGVPEALLATNRTFNPYTYDNQVDHYQQDHYQLLSSHQLSPNLTLNVNGFYTKGRGYFEQFREADRLSTYGLPPVVLGGDTVRRTDLVRRRWLDNDFYGTVFSLDYDSFKRLKLNVGGGWNRYTGKHFGEVIWARFASTSNIRERYYDNDATKTDANLYGKAFYQLTAPLTLFADVQVRAVDYSFLGFDNEQRNVQQTAQLRFLNPKIGLTYEISDNSTVYASYSVAHREPNRNDFTESTPQSRPRPEQLRDLEAGYRYRRGALALTANGYYMDYRDQLILTGQLNDVGAYIRTNVPRSYRAGLELEAGWQLAKTLTLNANTTLSRNKIRELSVFYDNYDDGTQRPETFRNTDIAFSPNVIYGGQLAWQAAKGLELAWLSKYVGKQYLDNTQDNGRRLNPYLTNDLRAIYTFNPRWAKEIGLSLLLNNVLNARYESNGYTFSYVSEGQFVTENFYYPQAGFNFLAGVTLKF